MLRNRLSCEIHPRLDVVSAAEWNRLFPSLLDPIEMIRLIQDVGLDGFSFHSLVVRSAGRPLLLLPLFVARFPLSTLVNDAMRPAVNAAAKWLPGLLTPRILGVGFAEGEWSQVGMDPSVGPELLDAVWELALEALEALADGLRADLTAFVHFTADSGRLLPMSKLRGFSELAGLPYSVVPIVFQNQEAYIRTLSAKMRADLRRKLRNARAVSVVKTREPGPWLEAIYQLYLETVANSEVVFGVQRRAYFERICRTVPGAEYWLYFANERLLAFKLVVVTSDCLIDKYFGMDHLRGREHSVYFVAWAQLIQHCIEQNIPTYHAGQSEEDTKGRLGAQSIPSLILFRHRNAVMHRLLSFLSRHISYEPKVPLPKAQLGTDWRMPPSQGPLRREPAAGLEDLVPQNGETRPPSDGANHRVSKLA